MFFKSLIFYAGCAAAWLFLLPVFVVVGGGALIAYAVFTELGALLTPGAGKSLDNATAREIAHRMCVGQ